MHKMCHGGGKQPSKPPPDTTEPSALPGGCATSTTLSCPQEGSGEGLGAISPLPRLVRGLDPVSCPGWLQIHLVCLGYHLCCHPAPCDSPLHCKETHPNDWEIPCVINSCISPIIGLKQPKCYWPLAKNSHRSILINENEIQEIQIFFLRIECGVVVSWSWGKMRHVQLYRGSVCAGASRDFCTAGLQFVWRE